MTTQSFHIVEAVYPGMTQLDFTGPHQVFSRIPGAKISVASHTGGEVESDGGLRFAGTLRLADITSCDLLFVPGGPGVGKALNHETFVENIRGLASTARYVTSVCTGSLLLGATGFLEGRHAACHWAYRDILSEFGAIPDPARVVRDGNIITGGGVTAGIDFALTIASEISGKEIAQQIQLMLEYAPEPPFNSGRPETAPAHVFAQVREAYAHILPERLAEIRKFKSSHIATLKL